MAAKRVVVIGASLAGLRAAETLRSEGFDGDVVVIGAESHRPYDRPPLSKKLLAGEWEPDRVQLRQPDSFGDLDVEWRFGLAAAGLDPAGIVHLTDGTDIAYDGCIIATGAACRRLPEQSRYGHVHELRTLDDAMRLRAEIADGGKRVVVIGAGFIGLEAAGTAHGLGNSVTVLEGGDAPLMRGLGAEMGAAIGSLHTAAGVDVRCGVQVERLHDDGVMLTGGELVEADVVLVGIGVVPATAWLADSGIALRDGVVCDASLRALDASGAEVGQVFAAGDVVRWPNELFDEEMRIEHWTNAAEQGALAAKNLLASMGVAGSSGEVADVLPYAPVPFFWSDQLDQRIQFVGRASADDDVVVALGSTQIEAPGPTDEAPPKPKWLALYSDPSTGRLRGALGVNAPKWVMPMRMQLQSQASIDDALARAAELN